MSTAIKNRKWTAYESRWQEMVSTVSHGEPVTVCNYSRSTVIKGIHDAKKAMAADGLRVPEHGLATQAVDGGIRVMPKGWQYRTPTDEQRQALTHFAASDMPEIFLPGLAVMDVEGLLQELSSLYAVQLRGEYAVHHLPGGVTDRACWVCRGGV
jgi:hypothetical protein